MAEATMENADCFTLSAAEIRADLAVIRLERFIRENRGARGVSFRRWQDMARAEIADLMRDVEDEVRREYGLFNRMTLLLGVGLTTAGLWGGVLAFWADLPERLLPLILFAAGGLLTLLGVIGIGMRTPLQQYRQWRCRKGMARARSLNRNIGDLENELKTRQKQVIKDLDEIAREFF